MWPVKLQGVVPARKGPQAVGRQVLAVRSTLGRGYMPPKYPCLVGKDETGQARLSAHA